MHRNITGPAIRLIAAAALTLFGTAHAEEYATAEQAEAMVAKAVAAVRADRAQAFKTITAKDPQWVEGDLYPVVYDMSGKVLAHGQNPKMVGKDLIDLRDADGKAFVRERVELAAGKGKFWQDYKFTDPVSKKVLPKRMYCEAETDVVICAGVYLR